MAGCRPMYPTIPHIPMAPWSLEFGCLQPTASFAIVKRRRQSTSVPAGLSNRTARSGSRRTLEFSLGDRRGCLVCRGGESDIFDGQSVVDLRGYATQSECTDFSIVSIGADCAGVIR